MIKKAPITEMYQVNMYCDKCGKIMERSNIVIDSFTPTYRYSCKCGYSTTSSLCLPSQMVKFNESEATELTEEELKMF